MVKTYFQSQPKLYFLYTVSFLVMVPPVLVGELPAAYTALKGSVFPDWVVNNSLMDQETASQFEQLSTNVTHVSLVVVSVLQAHDF